MYSIGGFREGEIDGKSYFIYTLLSDADRPTSSSSEVAIDSGENNLPSPPLFICPSLRLAAHELKHDEEYLFEDGIPFNTSPFFPSSDQQVQYLLDSDNHDNICKLPVVPLYWCNNKDDKGDKFCCYACFGSNPGTDYYFCVTCCKNFHKECVESPFEIKHPTYPFQSLQLVCDARLLELDCTCCETSFSHTSYQGITEELKLHPVCAMKPIPFTIDHPKRHPHSLTFFPKQKFLPCNICGLIKEFIPTYVCLRCTFVVHRDCIYFPFVIKISRHHHRISFTSSLPSGEWSCGVCRQMVDDKYGAYSCNNCSNYFVHTRCALRKDVCDGKELEGIPEELEIIIAPFERFADGIILHFSHDHRLKLETSRVCDEGKFCQACVSPIYEGDYYSCVDHCDFNLHETCATTPRKKQHALHPISLTLKVVTNEYRHSYNKGYFRCSACRRDSCGFIYEDDTRFAGFRLDLQCASISEPFEYQGHDHPLFLALNPEEESFAKCQICEKIRSGYHRKLLNCTECDFIICFRCATLPYEARYKHEKHLLTFCIEEKASDHFGWCEVCESKIVYSQYGGFYACNDCNTTLHVHCLLGKDPYMKPGQTIVIDGTKAIRILRNNTMSRPFCHRSFCKARCLYRIVFEMENKTYCSFSCLGYFGNGY